MIEIELDGERRPVALRREGDRWIADIDGRTLDVDVVEAGGRWSMLIGPTTVLPPEGGSHERPAEGGSHERPAEGGSHERPAEGGSHERPAEGGSHERGYASVASGFSRKSYDIAFEPTAGGELIVHVNGVAIPLTIVNEPGAPKPMAKAAGARGGGGSGPRTIVAPMPGRIVKVLVQPKERVTARQPLVVVEAMKMENELRAPRGGTVAEVRVAEGSSVEANTVLVVLE